MDIFISYHGKPAVLRRVSTRAFAERLVAVARQRRWDVQVWDSNWQAII